MTRIRSASLRTIGPAFAAVALAIVAFALHPHANPHASTQAKLEQIEALAAQDGLVHGTLIALMVTLLAGFARYSQVRGISRLPVLAGFVSFALGIGGLIAAGLIDGFVVPQLASRFASTPPLTQEAAIATLRACAVMINVFTAFGLAAMALAIAAWSCDLAREPGPSRIAAIVGCLAAITTGSVVATGGAALQPHPLMFALCAQGVWYVWISVLMARQPAEVQR